MASKIPGPSVSRMMQALNLDKDRATSIKLMMDGMISSRHRAEGEEIPDRQYMDRPRRILAIASKYADQCGVECLRRRDDVFCRSVVEYVNTGDTYADTLLYDYKTGRFYCQSWGDFVETRGNQFE